jgi:serine/threonine protein kinase/tetratricopeptide (TPR) repeat protein
VDPLRWKRIAALFAAACKLKTEERQTFLKEQCGDDAALFEQVLSLVEIDNKPGILDETVTLSRLLNTQIVADRFQILRHIGAGGMGDVYEAEDLQLKSRVALKTIRPEFASNSLVVERFKREILLGKRVTHPNVCRIHDLGLNCSPGGSKMLFLTMEFLDGETLSSRIKRGRLLQDEALPLIQDMVAALSASHEAGVVHRDFKSGNVMLVGGAHRTRAIVTDFGLAWAIGGDEQRRLTKRGAVAGSVDYMAPEQIKGEQVTPSSDIYSLGVVMYEMLTGRRPFVGDSDVSVAMKHINEQPRPPRALVPDLETNWDSVILRCLKKAPEQRFGSAEAVKAVLVPVQGELDSSTPGPRIVPRFVKIAIAVAMLIALGLAFSAVATNMLPHLYEMVGRKTTSSPVRQVLVGEIENQTGEPVLDHTVRELLTSTLEQSSTFKVFSAGELSEALRRMGKQQNAPIGEQLAIDLCQREGIQIAIVGSILRAGSEYVIIIKALDHRGSVITSVTEGAHSQKQIIRSIEEASRTLRKILGESAKSITATVPLERVTSISLQAVQYYTLGKLELYNGSAQNASNLFQRAIDIDPSFAMAHCYAGIVYERLGDIVAGRKELFIAVSLSDRIPEPERLKILGDYSLAMRDFRQAVKYYQTLGKLKPDLAVAHLNLGQAYLGEFNYASALSETDAAIRLQGGEGPEVNAIEVLFLSGRTEEAIERIGRVLKSHPEDPRALYFKGRCYLARGEIESAHLIFERLCASGTESQSIGYASLADMALARGQIEEAQRELQRAVVVDRKAHNPYGILLGTLALEAVNQKASRRQMCGDSPDLGAIQTDPRMLVLAASLCHAENSSNRLTNIVSMLERHRASHETAMVQSFLAIAKSALALTDNKTKAAIEFAQMAVQFENSPFAVDHLARTYAAVGKYPEAIAEFEKVLSRSNERMEAYDGPAYHRLREVHEVLSSLYWKVGDKKRSQIHGTFADKY